MKKLLFHYTFHTGNKIINAQSTLRFCWKTAWVSPAWKITLGVWCHLQPIQDPDIRWAFTGPLVLRFVCCYMMNLHPSEQFGTATWGNQYLAMVIKFLAQEHNMAPKVRWCSTYWAIGAPQAFVVAITGPPLQMHLNPMKHFSSSTQLSMKFVMLINVGIVPFICRINDWLWWFKLKNSILANLTFMSNLNLKA